MASAVGAPQISVFLAPGECFVGDARHCVGTLLGSCVSITLWQPERRVGAMSHFLLPERGSGPRIGDALDGRYGSEALRLMLRGLSALGVQPAQCEAKLFGGGDMFPGHAAKACSPNVGRRNGRAASRLLEAHDIPLVSHSLFGAGHRKIVFDIATGDVWSRQEPVAGDPALMPEKPPITAGAAARARRP